MGRFADEADFAQLSSHALLVRGSTIVAVPMGSESTSSFQPPACDGTCKKTKNCRRGRDGKFRKKRKWNVKKPGDHSEHEQ